MLATIVFGDRLSNAQAYTHMVNVSGGRARLVAMNACPRIGHAVLVVVVALVLTYHMCYQCRLVFGDVWAIGALPFAWLVRLHCVLAQVAPTGELFGTYRALVRGCRQVHFGGMFLRNVHRKRRHVLTFTHPATIREWTSAIGGHGAFHRAWLFTWKCRCHLHNCFCTLQKRPFISIFFAKRFVYKKN